MGSSWLVGRASAGEDENTLEMDGGEGCTVRMYLMPLQHGQHGQVHVMYSLLQ